MVTLLGMFLAAHHAFKREAKNEPLGARLRDQRPGAATRPQSASGVRYLRIEKALRADIAAMCAGVFTARVSSLWLPPVFKR